MPRHFYRTCKHFNKKKYSLEQNQRYYKKKHKEDTTNGDTKAPEGGRGGGTDPPRSGDNNSRRARGSNGSGGSNGVDRILLTLTQRTVASSHALPWRSIPRMSSTRDWLMRSCSLLSAGVKTV